MNDNLATPQPVLPLALTAFEQLMLTDDRPNHPMTFFIRIGVTGDLRKAEFESACITAVKRHPLLSANVRWRFFKPHWVPGSASLPVEWFEGSLPNVPLAERHIDLKKQSGLRVLVGHSPADSEILFQFHHAATDGIGAIQFIGDILAYYGVSTATTKDESPQIAPVDLACLHRRGDRWEIGKQPTRMFRRWMTRAVEIFKVHPCRIIKRSIVPKEQQEGRPLFLTRYLERPELKSLHKAAIRRGISVNELVALATFKSLYQWNKYAGRDASKDVFRICIPATVRTPAHNDCPAANVLSYILLTRRGRQIENQHALLHYIAKESRQVLNERETGLVLLSMEVACWIPGVLKTLTRLPMRIATSVLANVGDVKRQLRNRFPLRQGKCVAGNVELDHLLGAAPVRAGTYVATSVGKYAGRLMVNVNCDPQFFTATEAELFTDRFLEHLKQLCQSTDSSSEQPTLDSHAVAVAK